MLSSFWTFWLEIQKPLSIRNVSPKYEIWLRFYIAYRQNMTSWLKFFLAFYILVGQPALLGWMLDNCNLYELAGLNAWVFFVSWIISIICKPKNQTDNTAKVIEKSEQKISRIENDKGVAVVSVEKKQEVVVETANNDNQEQVTEWLIDDKEENIEENVSDRPMRENVTIPKIVQPLSWHQTPKKKKKELKRGQRLILFLTLGLAAVVAWTLREFLESRWIAIALFLGRILFLVIGKLFDVEGFYNTKKLFTNWLYIVLILAWIVYGVYATQDNSSFNLIKDKAVSYIEDRFDSEKDSEFGTWDEIYIFEWTGEVITDTWDMINSLINTWLINNETWNIATWNIEEIVVNIQPEVIPQPEVDAQSGMDQPTVTVENQEEAAVSDNPNREVTRWEVIKHLLQWYKLSTKTDKSFVYVAKSNELYPYFKTAQEKAMIWFDVNPSKRISCETYMSLKWILEWWTVNIYDRSQTRVIYRNKANELGKTNWCARWAFVKVKNL